MSVPVVDLSRPTAGSDLVSALRSDSCTWLVGHEIPLELQAAVRTESLAFFDLPRSEKSPFEWDGQGLWHGWQPVHEGGEEYGGAERPTELLERFEVNTSGLRPLADTLWPAVLTASWTAYIGEAGRLAGDLARLVADELDLPWADLPAWTEGQFANLVANHYPAQPDEPEEGRSRVNPHVDHGGFTLLLLDDAPGGLEAETAEGWTPVVNVPGAILVQGGELLTAWTGGRLPANRHRVVNPPRAAANTRRLSVIWFHHPDLDWHLADGRRAGDLVQARQEAYRGAA